MLLPRAHFILYTLQGTGGLGPGPGDGIPGTHFPQQFPLLGSAFNNLSPRLHIGFMHITLAQTFGFGGRTGTHTYTGGHRRGAGLLQPFMPQFFICDKSFLPRFLFRYKLGLLG